MRHYPVQPAPATLGTSYYLLMNLPVAVPLRFLMPVHAITAEFQAQSPIYLVPGAGADYNWEWLDCGEGELAGEDLWRHQKDSEYSGVEGVA